jgi:hypothetical protein
MADHAPSSGTSGGMDDHRATYEGFLKGSVGLALLCFYVLVALVSFRFGHTWSVFLGFLTLIVGVIAVAIDARTSSRWFLSLGLLVVFGLIAAVNVS